MPNDWDINLAGLQGQPGLSGTQGAAGLTGPSYAATSVTNIPIATGSVTLATQGGLAYQVGTRARLSYQSDPTQWMEGIVTAYDNVGSITVNVDLTSLTGTGAPFTPTGAWLNKFRNPGKEIGQRGAGGSIAAGSLVYTLDGWLVGPVGAAVSWSQVYGANLTGYALRISCANGLTGLGVHHRIESSIAAQLLKNNKTAQPVTVQYTIYNNSGITITPTLQTQFPNNRDNWSASTVDISSVTLQSIPNGSIGTVSYTFIPNIGCVLGYVADLLFAGQLNATSGYVDISYDDIRATPGVTLGLNNNPPVPEIRPVQAELAFCQRYYYSASILLGGFSAAATSATTNAGTFPVQMRTTPNMVFSTQSYAGTATSWASPNGNTAVFWGVATYNAAGAYLIQFNFTASAEL